MKRSSAEEARDEADGAQNIVWDESAAQRKADTIRQNADDAKAISLKFAQLRVDVYRRIEKARQADLDQVASNLQGQMEKPVIADGVRLKAEGTNLYVHNYAGGQATPEANDDDGRINPGKTLVGDKAKANAIDAIKGQRAKRLKDCFPHGQSATGIEDLRYTKEVNGKRLD